MEIKTFEDLYDASYKLICKHQDEETAQVKKMRDAIVELIKQLGGCIQIEKRETCVYHSGSYGKMYITKLAVYKDMLFAYCEGEKESCWWNKAVEPWYAHYYTYVALTRQICKRTYTPIEYPFNERQPQWVIG